MQNKKNKTSSNIKKTLLIFRTGEYVNIFQNDFAIVHCYIQEKKISNVMCNKKVLFSLSLIIIYMMINFSEF